MRYAKDYKCCKCKKEQAVAFWPNVDPDIEAYPWCRKCLDKAKMDLLCKLTKKEK